MRTSESIVKFAPAFRAAQEKLNGVTKTARNPFYQSTYATLDDCWKACKDILHEQKISVLQPTSVRDDGTMILTTRLQHDSGEFIEGDYLLNPVKADPQGYGSATTYARRYSLCAMIGLCAEEDDDGNAASHKNGQASNTPAQRATPKKNSTGLGDQLRAAIAQWSGVQPEDLPSAIRQVFDVRSVPKQKSKITEMHVADILEWVKQQMADGIEFSEAVAPQEV